MVSEGDYPELRIKAYAGRVLVAYFQDKVATLLTTEHQGAGGPSEVLLLAHGALSAICKWFLQVEAAQRYLTADEASEIYNTSLEFLAEMQKKQVLSLFPRSLNQQRYIPTYWRLFIHHSIVFFARFLKLYRALAKWHQRRGILQWALKPRFHVP